MFFTIKRIFILLFVLAFKANCAQVSNADSVNAKESMILVNPEQMPEYPGGDDAMLKDIRENLNYTSNCENIAGRVIVSFWVNEDGTLSDFCVVKSVCRSLDLAALYAFKKLKTFIPGFTNGKAVRTKMHIPIIFR